MERLLVVSAQVGGEELLGLGDGHVQLGFDMDPHLERAGIHTEHMTTQRPVLGYEMEVVAGDVDRPGVQGGPEADQGPHLVGQVELALMGGRLEQVLTRRGGESKKPKSLRYAWNFSKAIGKTWLR